MVTNSFLYYKYNMYNKMSNNGRVFAIPDLKQPHLGRGGAQYQEVGGIFIVYISYDVSVIRSCTNGYTRLMITVCFGKIKKYR